MLNYQTENDLLVIKASGKLTKADYEEFAPRFEQMVEEHGPLRVLIELDDFQGWDLPGFWEELRFDVSHRADMGRVAVIADKTLEQWGTKLSKPFFKAEIREFEHGQEEAARAWLAEG